MGNQNIINVKFEAISPVTMLLNALSFIIMGIFLLVKGKFLYEVLIWIILGFVIFTGFTYLISGLNRKEPIRAILLFLGYLIFSIFLIRQKILLEVSIPLLFGIWFIINATLRLVLAIQCIVMKVVGKVRHLAVFAISLGFGLSLIFNPLSKIEDLTLLIGLYFIFYGIFIILDFFEELMEWDEVATKIRRRARIPVPLFIAAFIPKKVLSGVNKYFEETDSNSNKYIYSQNKELGKEATVDLEIFIHLKKDGFESFGHVDICYKNYVYSYGCYDHHSDFLGGFVSDGTIAVSEREGYIAHCLEFEKKVLVGYGLTLSEAQKEEVEKSLNHLKSLFIDWKSDYQKMEEGLLPNAEYKDPASELYKATRANIYKLSSGPFKKYFALSTNCVQLADTITGSAGLDALSVKGVITPGNYYSLLNNMFERKNTIVISRNFYK